VTETTCGDIVTAADTLAVIPNMTVPRGVVAAPAAATLATVPVIFFRCR
jgi:hypothetical protein